MAGITVEQRGQTGYNILYIGELLVSVKMSRKGGRTWSSGTCRKRAAARRALGVPARLGAVRPVAGVSGRQRRAAHGRRDAAAPLRRPCRHGSAVFPPRRAALADAAGHRAVKLHKGNRQKFASAGFLPVSGESARAPLQSVAARGILFSLEKHLSAIRGQFSSKQSEGTS